MNINDGQGAVSHDTPPALFFGPQAIGVGVGGPNAQVLINNNDDFSRRGIGRGEGGRIRLLVLK